MGNGGSKRGSLQACRPQAQQDQLAYPVSAQGVENLEQLSRGYTSKTEIETPWYRHLRVFRYLVSIHGFERAEALDQVSLTGQL